MAQESKTVRLRPGLELRRQVKGEIRLFDPATGRVLFFSEREAPIVHGLAQGMDLEHLRSLLAAANLAVAADAYLYLIAKERLLESDVSDIRVAVRSDFDRERLDALHATVDYARSAIPLFGNTGNWNELQPGGFSQFRDKTPLLDRALYIENFPERLIPRGKTFLELCQDPRYSLRETSGTAGRSIQILHDRQYLNAVFNSTYGCDNIFDRRHALFAPHHCMSLTCHRTVPPFQERYSGFALLMAAVNVMQQSAASANELLGELQQTQIGTLVCNPYYVAQTLLLADAQARTPSLGRLYCGYDYCQETTRKWLGEAFGLIPHDIYGMSECGYQLARSCDHGSIHLNEEFFDFEFHRVERLQSWRLVVTTLRNPLSPLLRYQTDDLFQIEPDEEGRCACGSLYRRISAFDGRISDLVSIGSRSVTLGRFDRTVGAMDGVAMYQLVIDGADVTVHYVSDRGESRWVAERVRSALAEYDLNADQVTARLVRSIPTGRGDKMQLLKVVQRPV